MSHSYFPDVIFSEQSKLHQFVAAWYGKHLGVMKEPSLFELRSEKDLCIYRFLWLRTFHNPIAVRLIVNNDGSGQLISSVLSGAGGFDPGDIAETIEKVVSAENVQSFELALSRLGFWDLHFTEEAKGLDGASWIIEGVKDGKYHLVDRWCPKGLFKQTALLLVEFAGIKVDKIY
jgi:hypothetical protein